MKLISILVLTVFVSVTLRSQTSKYAVLDEKDQLVGNWEWVKDATSSPYAPMPDLDFVFISFSAGNKISMGALSYDGCPSYFLAYSNGTNITGTISDCCIAGDKGKKVNFAYEFDAAGDQLILTVKEEKYYYKRKN